MLRLLYRRLVAFGRERSGNVAITFALAALPLVGGVGAAVDYSQANRTKAALQGALDSAALMLSRDAATLNSIDLNSKALSYVQAMFNQPQAKNIVVTATYSDNGGSKVVVNGSRSTRTCHLGPAPAFARMAPVPPKLTPSDTSDGRCVSMVFATNGPPFCATPV